MVREGGVATLGVATLQRRRQIRVTEKEPEI
jgi:hypothetical protein